MSLLIDLPKDVEARLQQEADQQGLSKEQIATDLIIQALPPESGAEWVAWLQDNDALGAFAEEPDAQAFARRLRQEAEARHNPR